MDPTTLALGDGTFINEGVYLDSQVTIGRNVFIGPRALLITADHPLGDEHQRAGGGGKAPVRIGDGAWIGAGAIVLPGVTIDPGCVIGAGAVVTKDCAAHGVYVGVPARRVKDLPVNRTTSVGRQGKLI